MPYLGIYDSFWFHNLSDTSAFHAIALEFHVLAIMLILFWSPPRVLGSWREKPFICRELGSTSNYFWGAVDQVLILKSWGVLSECDFLAYFWLLAGSGA